MPARQKHKISIVDTGVSLFRRQGFARTGLNEICELSGAPKGSVYHYFPRGKTSIAVAAIEEAGRRVVATCESLADKHSSTADLVMAHAELLAGWMKQSGFKDGCPITTVLLELAPQERQISKAGRDAYNARIDFIVKQLEDDGFDEVRARSMAQLCVSALQGALIQSRVERSGKPIIATAEELSRWIRYARQRNP